MKSEFIKISDELFLQLGAMVTNRYGIKMPLEKKVMFQARLQRRLRELNICSFEEYAKKLLDNQGESDEFTVLADYISTNKTDFFREKEHFSFLTSNVLTELLKRSAIHGIPLLKIWSSGCSSGQEAYSLAITVEEFMRTNRASIDYSILATDISGRMLKEAKEAIYPMSQVNEVPQDQKHRYFLKSKNMKEPKIRLVKEIREKVRVMYLNLMDGAFPPDTAFDVIFLRNTLIYFSHEVQFKVLKNIMKYLKTGGYLFIGHSESLINMDLPLKSVAPSVYIKITTAYEF